MQKEQHNPSAAMLTTTTPTIEGITIQQYLGVVSAEVIIGANIFKDLLASLQDIVGGRSGTYERVLNEARTDALNHLMQRASKFGANAIAGIDFDYETVGAAEVC
jgi:uncharacterized protein YbjQ (UPF0145 family)